MHRKTAMLASGAIVLAMLVAGLAVTLGVTGPTADAQRARPAPRVHTTTKTITIHRASTAAAETPAVIYTTTGATVSTASGEDGYETDDAYETDDGYGGVPSLSEPIAVPALGGSDGASAEVAGG